MKRSAGLTEIHSHRSFQMLIEAVDEAAFIETHKV
jgi:hypothetical protein